MATGRKVIPFCLQAPMDLTMSKFTSKACFCYTNSLHSPCHAKFRREWTGSVRLKLILSFLLIASVRMVLYAKGSSRLETQTSSLQESLHTHIVKMGTKLKKRYELNPFCKSNISSVGTTWGSRRALRRLQRVWPSLSFKHATSTAPRGTQNVLECKARHKLLKGQSASIHAPRDWYLH